MSKSVRAMKRGKAKKKEGWKRFQAATGLPLSVFLYPNRKGNPKKIADALSVKI